MEQGTWQYILDQYSEMVMKCKLSHSRKKYFEKLKIEKPGNGRVVLDK